MAIWKTIFCGWKPIFTNFVLSLLIFDCIKVWKHLKDRIMNNFTEEYNIKIKIIGALAAWSPHQVIRWALKQKQNNYLMKFSCLLCTTVRVTDLNSCSQVCRLSLVKMWNLCSYWLHPPANWLEWILDLTSKIWDALNARQHPRHSHISKTYILLSNISMVHKYFI